MPSKITVEVHIAMNEDGDVETGCTAEEATDRLSENYGGQMAKRMFRTMRARSKRWPKPRSNRSGDGQCSPQSPFAQPTVALSVMPRKFGGGS
jgi:hypothetical protein